MTTKTPSPTTTTNAVEVGFNAEVREALANFVLAKADEKQAKERKESAELILREALGNADHATVGGVKAFSLERRSREVIDQKRLKEEYPEIFALLVKVTKFDFVKTA